MAAGADGGETSRDQALRRARVWQEPLQPIAAANLAANPPGGFRTEEVVPCTFRLQRSRGWTPKFECVLASGEDVKVKYGHRSAEVFGEVASTRLLSALGFGADRMYVVQAVRCLGCPLFPYPRSGILDAARKIDGREVTFTLAAIERKIPGRTIRSATHDGWEWPELDRIDAAAGGSSRAEIDALRLMAAFLSHWDTKSINQRLVCLEGGETPEGCSRPMAILHDVGATFGPRSVDLEGWKGRPIWADPAGCRLSMKDLPYGGTSFGEPTISEAGRRFLGDRLRQLARGQIVALFQGARFSEYERLSEAGRDIENWADAFEDKVRQIADRPPCPN